MLGNHNIKASVIEHIRIGGKTITGNAAHWNTLIGAYGAAGKRKLQRLCHRLCVIAHNLKEIAHLIQYNGVRVAFLDFGILLPRRFFGSVAFLQIAFRFGYERLHGFIGSAYPVGVRVGVLIQKLVILRCAEVDQLRVGGCVQKFKKSLNRSAFVPCLLYQLIGKLHNDKLTSGIGVRVIIDGFKHLPVGTVEIVIVIAYRGGVRIFRSFFSGQNLNQQMVVQRVFL